MKKRIISCIMAMMVATTILSGCSEDDVVDQVANVEQALDENVLMVKNGSPNTYPDKTYGETFDNFFGSPTWKYFVGTQDGPDDDGDGEPDYTKENVDVVEFTGYCMYKDVRVKALIQFELDKDAGTFEASYLSFNDVPQNGLTLAALLDTAFSGEESDTEDTEVEEDTETSENTTNTEEHVSEYVGDWIDTTSERCNMTIECDDGETYYIDINWSSSATENTHWELEAEYDEEENGLWYSGSCCNETYLDNGEVQEDYVYSNGQGFMFIGDDSCLHWDDYEEDAGSDCVFQRY